MKKFKNRDYFIKKKNSKWILFFIIVMVISGVAFNNINAATPSVNIVFYSNGSNSGLTTSQLLEVKTSDFAKEAYFSYTYTNNMVTEYRDNVWNSNSKARNDNYLYVFDHNRTREYNEGTTSRQVNTGETKTYTKGRFFAFRYGEWGKGSITVTVEDTNPASSTYQQKATKTIRDLDKPYLARDINAGVGTVMKGETTEIRTILATAGMPMFSHPGFTYGASYMPKFEARTLPEEASVRKEDIYNDKNEFITSEYFVSTPKAGIGTIYLSHKRASLSDFFYNNPPWNIWRWDYGEPEGSFDFYVFDHKPTIKTGLKTITLKDTIQGVTYTLGSESYTCTKDNQEIVFGKEEGSDGFLMIGKPYLLEMSKKVNGKNARYMMDVETNGTSYVTYDFNGVQPEGTPGESQKIPYNSKNLGDVVLTAKGYDFLGWNSEPDGSGINYSTTTVNKEYVTVYAQWKQRFYNAEIEVSLDGQPYTNTKVELYQNETLKYSLSNTAGTNVYTATGIEYSKPGAGDCFYDIYVDGRDSDVDYVLTGDEVNETIIKKEVHCYSANVELLKEGDAWENQKVVLNKGGQEYDMTFDATKQKYTHMFIYDKADVSDGPYNVYVNDKLIQKGTEVIQFTITNKVNDNGVSLNYYSVSMDIQKDDSPWSDRTVTLRQDGNIKAIMEYNATTKKYEVEGLIDFGQQYDVYVEGANSKEDVGIKVDNANQNGNLKYYTVSFKDAKAEYNKQIVRAGETARKPSTPVMDGNTFAYWSSQEDGGGSTYFQNGITTTDPITAKTNIWAIWVKPSVKLGMYIRCDDEGNKNTRGTHYRLSNIAILGFPGGSGKVPIRIVELSISDGNIIVNNPGSYNVAGNNSTKVTITLGNGASMSDAEKFIKNNIVVKPDTTKKPHKLKVRIFGVTG